MLWGPPWYEYLISLFLLLHLQSDYYGFQQCKAVDKINPEKVFDPRKNAMKCSSDGKAVNKISREKFYIRVRRL